MIKRSEIANMVLSAQKDGATHLFVARDHLDTERFYGVRVMPGQDPHEVHDQSDDWMQECYALQDPSLPVPGQLAERRAWHMAPAGQERTSSESEPSTPELVALQAVMAEYRAARSFTFSPGNHPPSYERFEEARRQLIDATRAAYEEGVLTPFQIRRTTGYSRAHVAAGSAPGAPSSMSRSRGVALSPAAEEARSSAVLGRQERSRPLPRAPQPATRPWWSQPVDASQAAGAGLD
jgi:hypothetical protein